MQRRRVKMLKKCLKQSEKEKDKVKKKQKCDVQIVKKKERKTRKV